jgi:hypothetical protein
MGDKVEEDATSINILRELPEHGREEEHHIVEWVEAVPEGRADEGGEVVHQTGLLARHQSSVVDVELQPQVDLVVPVLKYMSCLIRILPAS